MFPPVVHAVTTHWISAPRLPVDLALVTSTQSLTGLWPLMTWAALRAVDVADADADADGDGDGLFVGLGDFDGVAFGDGDLVGVVFGLGFFVAVGVGVGVAFGFGLVL
jgi:hypothetical protein